MRHLRSVRIAASLAVVLALVALVPGAALAGGGNSAAAHRCQMGGWASLEDAAGNPFADQSACVSYAAGGGSLFQPTFTVVTHVGTGTLNGRTCCFFSYDLTGTGFHPNSEMTLHWVYSTDPYSDNEWTFPANFSTDGSGAFSSLGYWHQNCLAPGDVVAGTLTATDASGVSRSTTFTGTCNG